MTDGGNTPAEGCKRHHFAMLRRPLRRRVVSLISRGPCPLEVFAGGGMHVYGVARSGWMRRLLAKSLNSHVLFCRLGTTCSNR